MASRPGVRSVLDTQQEGVALSRVFGQLTGADGLLSVAGFGSLLSLASSLRTFPDLVDWRVGQVPSAAPWPWPSHRRAAVSRRSAASAGAGLPQGLQVGCLLARWPLLPGSVRRLDRAAMRPPLSRPWALAMRPPGSRHPCPASRALGRR